MVEKKSSETKTKKIVSEKSSIKDNKMIAVLSYLGILVVVPLLLKSEDAFVKFHVKQGIILVIGWIIGMVLYPFMGLGFLIHITIVVFSIMGIINVSEEKMKDLPFVGEMAKKLKF